ncbi:MAG TPA: tripartite tricarboxylate transporter substrate binding protein [Burkholderiaceae bacterium]|nr:tripartite tricarboxylate transporter substrate binding protein [Burkholderiaceae bacterium]
MISRRALLAVLIAGGQALAVGVCDAQAQGYPTKPIRLVVANPPGGLTDTVSRMLSARLQEAFGQPVLVDNKPGANGSVAASTLLASPADGYTFLVADGSLVSVNPLTTKKLAYDPVKDFVAVALVARAPLFLAVSPALNVGTLEQLVAVAKASPGKLTYGSSGIGSTHHLTMEALKAALGLDIVHVPYKGSSASVPALVGQQVDMVFSAYPSIAGFVKSGQVRLVAVNSAQRSPLAPEVPTVAETIKGFDYAPIVILLALHGTPPEAIKRMSDEVAKIAKHPDAVELMRPVGVDLVGGSAAQLARALDEERARMAKTGRLANLQPE